MVAAALGALLGVLLVVASHWAVRFITSEDPMRGLMVVVMMLVARFAVALAALAAFYYFVPAGLAPFGILLAASFFIGLLIEAVRLSGPRATRTPA